MHGLALTMIKWRKTRGKIGRSTDGPRAVKQHFTAANRVADIGKRAYAFFVRIRTQNGQVAVHAGYDAPLMAVGFEKSSRSSREHGQNIVDIQAGQEQLPIFLRYVVVSKEPCVGTEDQMNAVAMGRKHEISDLANVPVLREKHQRGNDRDALLGEILDHGAIDTVEVLRCMRQYIDAACNR